jgi:hypothetical protein
MYHILFFILIIYIYGLCVYVLKILMLFAKDSWAQSAL